MTALDAMAAAATPSSAPRSAAGADGTSEAATAVSTPQSRYRTDESRPPNWPVVVASTASHRTGRQRALSRLPSLPAARPGLRITPEGEEDVGSAVERAGLAAHPRLPVEEPLPPLGVGLDGGDDVGVGQRHAVARGRGHE